MSSILTIDLDKIVFSKSKVKTQNKFHYVYYDKKPLVLKFPKTRLPFGLNKDTFSDKNQYILDVSLEDAEEHISKLKEFDETIIKKAQEEIFPESSIEELRAKYVSPLKIPANEQYKPTFRTKIITDKDKKIKCNFYSSEKNENGQYLEIDVEKEGGDSYLLLALQKNSYIETVSECLVLWSMGDKFGVSFKTIQVKIFQKKQEEAEQSYDFIGSDSDTTNSELDFAL